MDIPDPNEPMKTPITNSRAIINGLNKSGLIMDRFCPTNDLLTDW
ncbi:Uncharacterised protein [Streptococcus pneumoniae]|nr:Uncharacterised protein [Streptococcus pneumoniae]